MASRIGNKIQWLAEHHDHVELETLTGPFASLSKLRVVDSRAAKAEAKRKAEIRDKRGWLGVLIQEVTRELAESFGMDKPHGALVAKVLPNSPAAAGIKRGDVIVKFNGVEIDLSSDLPPLVGGTEVGKKIPVEIVRDGKSLKLDLEIGELPPEEEPKHASSDKADTATTGSRSPSRISPISSGRNWNWPAMGSWSKASRPVPGASPGSARATS